MAILTHGSDLRLAPAIKPLISAGDGTVKGAIARAQKLGFEAVQLDATVPGIRPRDLSHRARRDLVALLSRHDMQLAGVDLFIPRRHFTESEHVDRAVSACLSAITLAADLGRVPVSLGLPVADITDDVKNALAEAIDGHSLMLAVHHESNLDALTDWLDDVDQNMLKAGFDPAAVLARDQDAVASAQKLGKRIGVARLSDISDGAVRCPAGEGNLDVLTYRMSLDLATGRSGPVVLDLRGLDNPFTAATKAKEAWEAGAISL